MAANSASHLGYLQVHGGIETVGMRICIKVLDKCQHQHAVRQALWSSQAHGLNGYRSADDGALRGTYCDIGCLPTRISNKMPVTTGEARLQLVHTTRAKPAGKRCRQHSCRDTCAAAVWVVGNRIQHGNGPASRCMR